MTDPRIAGMTGYTLLRELGRGGMAVVYLAEQQSLGREVALKVMSPGSDQDPTLVERFLREARTAANLRHPHIVAVHDFGVYDGRPFIAMDYEPGGSVLPPRGECLEPRAALRIVRDIADALDYAHSRGVVHRDIKPDNILRRADGGAMLSDFGIARMMHGESVLTAEGTSVGTPHYMSPEQLRGDKIDGRSDLYGLGVVLWQLLTGELPYNGTDAWSIGTQHVSSDIPRLPPRLAHLQALVDALMAKKAEARIQTGAELMQRIDALLSTNLTPVTAPSIPSAAHRRRRDGTAWRVGRVVLLGALVLVVAWLGWRQFGRSAFDDARAAKPTAQPAAVAPAAAPAVKSIAVLAFDDLSEARDQGYLSDGISEELLNRLSQVPGLKVAGRSSSRSFKDKDATIAQIGKALDVGSVLEGSVRKDGDRLRISVQLSNVADGYQLWSQSYDRKLVDVFAVQEEIAQSVVDSLKVELLPGASAGAPPKHVPRFEVYDQFLRGRQAMVRSTAADFRLALASFRKAVELDPDYADAWSALAMAESFVGESERDETLNRQAQVRALAASKRAIELDPSSGDALATHSYLLNNVEWDWSGALDDARKSVILGPHDARNHLRLAHVLSTINRLPEARAALEEATRADPLFTPSWYWLGRVKAAEGDLEGSRQAMKRVLAIDPSFSSAESYLGILTLLEGDAAAAHAEFSRLGRRASLLMAEYSLGNEAAARKGLNDLIAQPGPPNYYAIATTYAWMGDKDQAFLWLDKCVETRDGARVVVAFDPLLRKLRPDPRYKALLKKFKLPDQ